MHPPPPAYAPVSAVTMTSVRDFPAQLGLKRSNTQIQIQLTCKVVTTRLTPVFPYTV